MKIMYVTSECAPFIKTGGLGDVAGSLPQALAAKGHDVRVFCPLYSAIDQSMREKFYYIKNAYVRLGWRNQYCGIFRYEADGVTYYFIDNEYYFARGQIYGEYDDAERFAYYSKAVLEVLPDLEWKPDVINCNDWQTALVPVYYNLMFASRPFYENIKTVFTYQDGIFGRWFLNTILYVVVGAGGATLLAIMGGYALAKFRFPGRKAVFAVIIGAISVPGIALAVPQFLLFAKLGLTNTPWAMIIPSLISPFGLYLMWIFSEQAVPTELLEAALVDGASEFRTFFQVSLPLLAPGIVTTALFTIVATWNNYFLPLIMLKDADWYPLTIGLNQWKDQASTAGGQAIQNLVITGSLITIIPLVIAFLCLQKYWQSGLSAGAVKE